MRLDRRSLLLAAGACALPSCGRSESRTVQPPASKAMRLVAAARAQVGVTVRYDPAYTVLQFPMRDVPRSRGPARM